MHPTRIKRLMSIVLVTKKDCCLFILAIGLAGFCSCILVLLLSLWQYTSWDLLASLIPHYPIIGKIPLLSTLASVSLSSRISGSLFHCKL